MSINMSKVDDIFIKPKIDPLDINAQRIRRNILVTSIISFFLTYGSSGIDTENSSFVGVKFDELNIDYIKALLILMLVYLIAHFLWYVSDDIKANALKLTGIAIKKKNLGSALFPSDGMLDPVADETEQSTLYSWWVGRQRYAKEYKECLEQLLDDGSPINNHEKHAKVIETMLIEEEHISKALQRFDRKFWSYQKSQLLRWIIADVGMPTCVGISSIIILIRSL